MPEIYILISGLGFITNLKPEIHIHIYVLQVSALSLLLRWLNQNTVTVLLEGIIQTSRIITVAIA